MKNQYFGDNRDLFNYDLVMQIMRAGLVDHFTFIPMLTKPDNTKHGGKTDRTKAKAGTKNKELMNFLDKCVREGRRNIKELEGFFQKEAIRMTIYAKDKYFTREHRQEYFKQIGDGLLRKSLIFVDPDKGLEVKNSTEQHILYSEVKDLYRRMDKSSVLMIAQFFPRQPRQEYLNWRCEELKEKITSDWPICIDDGDIIFFFLTKNQTLEESLIKVIKVYMECYS